MWYYHLGLKEIPGSSSECIDRLIIRLKTYFSKHTSLIVFDVVVVTDPGKYVTKSDFSVSSDCFLIDSDNPIMAFALLLR